MNRPPPCSKCKSEYTVKHIYRTKGKPTEGIRCLGCGDISANKKATRKDAALLKVFEDA